MSTVRVIAWKAVALTSALVAGLISADERHGEQLFESEQCIQCHSVNGRGGTSAPTSPAASTGITRRP